LPPLSPPASSPEAGSAGALPAPGSEALAQSTALVDTIRAEIRQAGGAIGFGRYMELALYAPGLGYYSGGTAKLGAAGDFVTAPEISPLFGRCIARQVAEVLDAIGGGEVLELGGGSGALAEAALEEAGGDLAWSMLEPSPELQARQQARLGDRVRWCQALPAGFKGVILANEVADALPVERFRICDGEPRRLGVACADAGFGWTLMAPEPEFVLQLREIEAAIGEPLPEGFSGEFCPLLKPWVGSLCCSLERGLVLIFDYGLPRKELYAPERDGGTLICHYRHRAHGDPFLWPGLQDLSAWVDFTAVAEAGTEAGLVLEGFTTQAAFLAGAGIGTMLPGAGVTAAEILLAQQARRLLLPGEMGERFRVMGLSRGLGPALSGFMQVDLAARL
jgi:SAM-dependent MidA family methyltransferase